MDEKCQIGLLVLGPKEVRLIQEPGDVLEHLIALLDCYRKCKEHDHSEEIFHLNRLRKQMVTEHCH